jgi:hypothetical protein
MRSLAIVTALAILAGCHSPRGRTRTDLTDDDVAALAAFVSWSAPIKIELGFATNGKDWTGDGADDGIELHLAPRDGVGSAIKTPGSAKVKLVAADGGIFGGEKEIDEWVVSTDSLRISWNEGLFPAYILPLPWHASAPAAGPYELRVEFTPLYGQPLTARKDVTVRMPSK